ncbi:hypothetical protein VTL71DRAFT_4281 [Oculimacula yallundae]|uniref:Uncharacterized protein n=1 Tax=Oculimacula yallundae TaxID=86028 RepID=A0ABR4C645_9HELO
MHFSPTALALVLGLVAAAPRHESHNVFTSDSVNEVVLSTHEHGINKAIIKVEIDTMPGTSSQPDMSIEQEKIPGWVFLEGKRFQARIHGNTFWNVKGELDENFPIEDFLLDPLIFSLNHPADFEGSFSGRIGRGEVNLKWEKSGATIVGRSGAGDFEIKGKTRVDWSP